MRSRFASASECLQKHDGRRCKGKGHQPNFRRPGSRLSCTPIFEERLCLAALFEYPKRSLYIRFWQKLLLPLSILKWIGRIVRSAACLDHFPIFRTSVPDEARNIMTTRFGARRFELPAGMADFYAHGNYLQIKQVGLAFCSYGARAQLEFAETPDIRQRFWLHGLGSLSVGRNKAFEIRPDQSCIVSPGRASVVEFGSSFQHLLLKIDADLAARKLSSLIGANLPGQIDVDTVTHSSNPQAYNFAGLIQLLVRQFDITHTNLPDLVLEELQQMIVVAFLCCNQHSYSRLLVQPKDSALSQVKRVEDYIEAHWDQPITIESLTALVSTSARSIFNSFKKNRGYSPMAFAKRVRLKHARTMLLFPEQGTSVTGVAFACGFHNLGHFARDYRETFGELPSATLGHNRHYKR
jgi:AraC-like DNA-binding protein